MTSAEREWYLAVTDAMKSRGVRSFEVAGKLRVEFGDAAAAPSKSDAKLTPEDERCACGHLLTDHQNGLCVAMGGGCDPAQCEAKEEA